MGDDIIQKAKVSPSPLMKIGVHNEFGFLFHAPQAAIFIAFTINYKDVKPNSPCTIWN